MPIQKRATDGHGMARRRRPISPTDWFDLSRSGAGNMQGNISCLAGDIYEMMRNKKSCSAIQY